MGMLGVTTRTALNLPAGLFLNTNKSLQLPTIPRSGIPVSGFARWESPTRNPESGLPLWPRRRLHLQAVGLPEFCGLHSCHKPTIMTWKWICRQGGTKNIAQMELILKKKSNYKNINTKIIIKKNQIHNVQKIFFLLWWCLNSHQLPLATHHYGVILYLLVQSLHSKNKKLDFNSLEKINILI